MKTYKYLLIFLATIVTLEVSSQQITGNIKVVDAGEQSPATGANIFLPDLSRGTAADDEGNFKLELPKTSVPEFFIVSFIGFENDTFALEKDKFYEILLDKSTSIAEVTVRTSTPPTFTAVYRPINRVTISERELQKAACCNLAESFETNPTVDISYSDAVSGARKIQMLGLDGKYVQIGFENIPIGDGLNYTYGLTHIPGPWLDNIHITKGAGSVYHGFNAMTGQIMLDFKRPERVEDPLYFNAYVDHSSRTEANVLLHRNFGHKWSGLVLFHGNYNFLRMDMNGNNFMDMPLNRQLNIMNRWTYDSHDRILWQFGVSGVIEDRQGGEMDFRKDEHLGTDEYYGIVIDHQKYSAFSKLAYLFPEKPYKSIGWIARANYLKQNSVFGLKEHNGEQISLYQNLVYQSIISNTNHVIRTGTSLQADFYNESYADRLNENEFEYDNSYIIPGVFAEYTYTFLDQFSLVAGLRADYFEQQGIKPTPRIHLRYQPLERTTIRLSAGTGWRIPYFIPENLNFMATSKIIELPGVLRPEESRNYGISLHQSFNMLERPAYFSVDFYRTDFDFRWLTNWDEDPDKLVFTPLENASYANSFQAELFFEPIENLELKIAYKWDDVKVKLDDSYVAETFVPKHQGLFNLSYSTAFDRWQFDFTTKLNGSMRLPDWDEESDVAAYQNYSPVFTTFNSQITHRLRKLDIYVGAENIGNFKQKDPVIGYEEPFGKDFDATQVWGPVFGAKIYAGIRLTL
ncbi:MAG: TonB-dependent receptor [Chitinophagaceae bacterium]|nr:MAG: TonB-dependent receptor [Chitinophagaceae bacterium]